MLDLKSEEDIISSWVGDVNQPVVSICCITYNHIDFIADALNGFLSQVTIFPFEILIHDDASTDGTPEVIKAYEEQYPRLIKPIYQSNNQFSLGKKISLEYNFPRARGRYAAFCEGDDFWSREDKLQIQVELMEANPDVDISFHPSYELDFLLGAKGVMSWYGARERVFSVNEVILGDGAFMPTPSLVVKSAVLKSLPAWFRDFAPVGDFYIQIIASINGGALYFPLVLSSYRCNVPGSWTSTHREKEKRAKWLVGNFKALSAMDLHYNSLFTSAIKKIFTKYILVVISEGTFSREEMQKMIYEFSTLIDPKKIIFVKFAAYLPLWTLRFLKYLRKFFLNLHHASQARAFALEHHTQRHIPMKSTSRENR